VELDERTKKEVDSTWEFEHNWGWACVTLSNPKSAISFSVSKLFEPLKDKFLGVEPLDLDTSVLPEDSVSQVSKSGGSSASGDGKAALGPGSAPMASPASKFRKVLKSQGSCKVAASPPLSGTGRAACAASPGA